MYSDLQVGDNAYIVDNNRFLREVRILKITKDLCVIKYVDTGALIRIRKTRLFCTKRDAELSMPPSVRPGMNHWDYERLYG